MNRFQKLSMTKPVAISTTKPVMISIKTITKEPTTIPTRLIMNLSNRKKNGKMLIMNGIPEEEVY